MLRCEADEIHYTGSIIYIRECKLRDPASLCFMEELFDTESAEVEAEVGVGVEIHGNAVRNVCRMLGSNTIILVDYNVIIFEEVSKKKKVRI